MDVHPLSLPALVVTAYFVSLATVVVPGPITLVASRLALQQRVSAAFWFLVGVTVLDIALFLALAAGAAPALRRIGALPIVEIVGGMALLWGGIASLRAKVERKPRSRRIESIEPRNPLGDFALGLLVAAGNPHYWIWWVTAGLAFVEAARTHGASGLAWMLGALIAGVVSWYVPLLWALDHGRAVLSPRAERIVIRSMGVALIALGAGLMSIGVYRFK